MVDGGVQTELKGRVGCFTVEDIEGVAGDKFHRGGGETDLQGVEVIKQVTVLVVDTAVAFVSDDQVEEAHIELGEAIHHAWVSGDVDASGLIHFVGFANHAAWLAGQVLLEGLISLHAQFLAVTEKQHTLGPAGTQQQLGQSDGHTCFAGAGSLNDQSLAPLLLEVPSNGFDRLDLVWPIGNAQLWVMPFQLGDAVLPLVDKVFKAVLAVEAIHRAVSVVLLVVPDKSFVAVAVENHRALHAHALESIGIHTGLLTPGLQADIAGFLGFDYGQGLTVVTP